MKEAQLYIKLTPLKINTGGEFVNITIHPCSSHIVPLTKGEYDSPLKQSYKDDKTEDDGFSMSRYTGMLLMSFFILFRILGRFSLIVQKTCMVKKHESTFDNFHLTSRHKILCRVGYTRDRRVSRHCSLLCPFFSSGREKERSSKIFEEKSIQDYKYLNLVFLLYIKVVYPSNFIRVSLTIVTT